MSYNVGQVLFIVLNKKTQVYPMLIVEEIVKRNLRGEEISYVLQAGSDPETRIMLNQVDGEIFESAEEARKSLVEKATFQIDRLVETAVEKSRQWYSVTHQSNIVHELPAKQDEGNVIVLPDGTKARLRTAETA